MLRKKALAVFLVFCLLCACSALAAKYGYPVDIEAMKALEAQSSCPVRVTEKKIVLECFDLIRFSDDGADAFVVTVTNGTDSVVTSVTVGFIALDEEGLTTDVVYSGLTPVTIGRDASPEMKSLVRTGLALAPGESCIISTRVDYKYMKGARAMVMEYGLEDGSVLVNPDFELWQMYAFGLNSGTGTELD